MALSQTFTQKDFLDRAKEKHGDKYNYDKVKYINSQTKIIISCNTCNYIFEQLPNSHLRGCGCDKCAHKINHDNQRLTKEEIIKRALEKHGNLYDYSEINYINMNKKIRIKCNKGHIFEQLPTNHIRLGYGCPQCAKRTYSKIAIEWIKYISLNLKIDIQHAETNIGEYKISKSQKRADGYNKKYNCIFEYHGCHAHGCIDCYPERNRYDLWGKRTHNYNYIKTNTKKQFCIEEGYKYFEIWDCEWKNIKNNDELLKNMLKNITDLLKKTTSKKKVETNLSNESSSESEEEQPKKKDAKTPTKKVK